MSQHGRTNQRLAFHPLTPERWRDFETLFGPQGAYGGCWCMWWRCTRAAFERNGNDGNRQALKASVRAGEVPGILAYEKGAPVGWCSIAPREQFGALNRSPVLKPIDDTPVWSLVCLYVPRDLRGQGLALALIGGAIDYAQARGGSVVEAYPTVPKTGELPAMHAFMGTPEILERAGFVVVAQPSQAKMIMRYTIPGES